MQSSMKYVLSTFSVSGGLLGPGNTVPVCSSEECRQGPVLTLRGRVGICKKK